MCVRVYMCSATLYGSADNEATTDWLGGDVILTYAENAQKGSVVLGDAWQTGVTGFYMSVTYMVSECEDAWVW